MVLEATGLRKRYGTVRALDGVNLRLERGEIFGLLGRNGAGKTTCVKILLGLVFPTGGRGTLLGQPLGSVAVKRRVGYLPEDHRLPEYLTAEAALHFFGRLAGLARADRRRRLGELLERFELRDWRRTKIRKFSKGMKQRLALAQAVLHDPELLFLDEPTDGVDPLGRRQTREFLRELRERGVTVFLNSHLLSEVEELCDRVAILDRGRVVREGSIAALTRGGDTYRLKVEGDTAPLREELARRCVHLEDRPGGFAVTVRTPADLDGIVDLLRGRGVGLRELALENRRLEDVFVEALREGAEGE